MQLRSFITRAALALASSAILSPAPAIAAETTEIKVKGIIKPPACTPNLASGGVIDYGVIPASTLRAGGYTVLTEKLLPFSISCNAATKMAVRASDNRASSMVAGIVDGAPVTVTGARWGDPFNFGLGTVADKKIGGYILAFKQESFKSGNQNVDTIVSADAATWKRSSMGGAPKSEVVSWAIPGTTNPASLTSVTGTLSVTAVLNKPGELPLGQEISLDGSATLEVIYL